ncbi:anaerobic glycerol-3-phosphate dehydrogenase subunit C, partial [Halorubrum sp. SD626R]
MTRDTRTDEDDGRETTGEPGETTDDSDETPRPGPGVPRVGRDEQPSIFVPDEGDSAGGDAARLSDRAATDGGVESATGGSDSAELDPDAYDPVDVFPGGDLDLREGADSCYKCTSCDTSCP